MLGAIIGDICGSVYEWNNEKNIDKVKLFKRGCFPTDDSVMTVAVARALMDTKGMPDDKVKEALIDSMHYFGGLFPNAGYGGHFGGWINLKDRQAYNSWGNGSAMRVASVGWIFNTMDEVLKYAKLTAEVTHNHPEGIKGAQAIAACIAMAKSGAPKSFIRFFVQDNFYYLNFTLDEIRSGYSFDESCQGTCPFAIEAFLESESFEDAIKKAISIGGDSDTIAAITGSIAEAFYGIPEDIKKKAYQVLSDTKGRGGRVYNNSVLRRVYEEFERNYVDDISFGNMRICREMEEQNNNNRIKSE